MSPSKKEGGGKRKYSTKSFDSVNSVNTGRKFSGKSFSSVGTQSIGKYDTPLEKFLRQNILNLLTLVGLLLGVALGTTLRYSFTFSREYWSERRLQVFFFLGPLFTSMLHCIRIPLIVSSIAAAIGSMDLKTFRFAILRMFIYIFAITFIAISFGALIVMITHPGRTKHHPIHRICYSAFDAPLKNVLPFNESTCTEDHHPCYTRFFTQDVWKETLTEEQIAANLAPFKSFCGKTVRVASCEVPSDIFLDLIEIFFPDNIINAFRQRDRRTVDLNSPNEPGFQLATLPDDLKITLCELYTDTRKPKPSIDEFDVSFRLVEAANLKGLIFFSLIMGLAALSMEATESGRPLLNIFTSLSECMLKIATWTIWVSPFGICSIVASNLLTHDIAELPFSLYLYLQATLVALFLYGFVILPLLYYAILHKSPFRFYRRLLPVFGVTFGTASSSASIPVTMSVLEDDCHLDPRIVRLMVPVTVELNLDGSAIAIIVAIVYTIQLHGHKYDFCDCIISILMTFTSIIVISGETRNGLGGPFQRRMLPILASLDVPPQYYVYVLNTTWILDFFAQVVNVMSHCVGIAIVDHLCIQQLEIMRWKEQKAMGISNSRTTITNKSEEHFEQQQQAQKSQNEKFRQQINPLTASQKKKGNKNKGNKNQKKSAEKEKPGAKSKLVQEPQQRRKKGKDVEHKEQQHQTSSEPLKKQQNLNDHIHSGTIKESRSKHKIDATDEAKKHPPHPHAKEHTFSVSVPASSEGSKNKQHKDVKDHRVTNPSEENIIKKKHPHPYTNDQSVSFEENKKNHPNLTKSPNDSRSGSKLITPSSVSMYSKKSKPGKLKKHNNADEEKELKKDEK